MKFEVVRTKKLQLRKISPEVLHFVFTNFSDAELTVFLGLNSEEELSKEKEKFDQGLTTFNRKFLYFQLLNTSTRQVVGWCGYHTWYTDHDRAELGYSMFDEGSKQKGLMTEALKFVIDYGFNQMKLHRIEALISMDNIPSLKLLQRCNFKQEGTLREHYYINNRFEDSTVFSLLRSEYAY